MRRSKRRTLCDVDPCLALGYQPLAFAGPVVTLVGMEDAPRPLTFSLAPNVPATVVVQIAHDFNGDLEELQRDVQAGIDDRKAPIAVRVERLPPPPGPNESRVAATSKNR